MIQHTKRKGFAVQRYDDTLAVNRYCKSMRRYFDFKHYEQIEIYGSTDNLVYPEIQVHTDTGLTLRANTEPDVWEVGLSLNADRFYCISSIYRNEQPKTDLHLLEFKIIDFYRRACSLDDMLSEGINLLNALECDLSLPALSQLSRIELNKDFNAHNEAELLREHAFSTKQPHLLHVNKFPIDEGVFDGVSKIDSRYSTRNELYYFRNGEYFEISVFGSISNKNRGKECTLSRPVDGSSDQIYGMCFGIERLIRAYSSLSKRP